MTDFQFLNPAGTIDVTFRTDFIGAASAITGGENITVCDILDASADDEKALFANWQKIKYTISQLKTFATDNGLKLIATPVSKPGVATADLATVTLAVPTSLAGTVNSATQVTLTWTKNANATGYVLTRATDSGFTANVVNTTLGDVATKVVTGLTTATTYYWKLKATAPNANDSVYTSSINKTTS